jgi:hypothetical protein
MIVLFMVFLSLLSYWQTLGLPNRAQETPRYSQTTATAAIHSNTSIVLPNLPLGVIMLVLTEGELVFRLTGV